MNTNCPVSLEEAKAFGFTDAAWIDPQKIEFYSEVREMCAADRCRSYNRYWCCPPACGTPEEIAERVRRCKSGILLQTTGKLEDCFDAEGMALAQETHKKSFEELTLALRERGLFMLPMAAGRCTRCEACTWPNAPCRFPALCFPSMEACGMLVLREAQRCGLRYSYGENTMSYFSCILFR